MRITVLKQSFKCDKCQEEQEYQTQCVGCNKDFCYNCRYGPNKYGKTYDVLHHGNAAETMIYFCGDCDMLLRQTRTDPLFNMIFDAQQQRVQIEQEIRQANAIIEATGQKILPFIAQRRKDMHSQSQSQSQPQSQSNDDNDEELEEAIDFLV